MQKDLISRQMAVETIMGQPPEPHYPSWYAAQIEKLPAVQPEQVCVANVTLTDEQVKEVVEKAKNAVISVIELEQRWIPCSERCPKEEQKEYWICTDTGYQCECRWTNVNHFWTDLTTSWHWHIMDVPQYTKVVAWMPLPEPYKGGEM